MTIATDPATDLTGRKLREAQKRAARFLKKAADNDIPGIRRLVSQEIRRRKKHRDDQST